MYDRAQCNMDQLFSLGDENPHLSPRKGLQIFCNERPHRDNLERNAWEVATQNLTAKPKIFNSQVRIEPWMAYHTVRYYIEIHGTPSAPLLLC